MAYIRGDLDADDISDAVLALEKRLKEEHAGEIKLLNSHIHDIESELAETQSRILLLEKLLDSMGTGWLAEYEKELARLRGA